MRDSSSGKGIAWLALLVATIALMLAWVSYNRTADQALEDTIKEKVQEAVEQVETRMRREGVDEHGETATSTERERAE